MITAISASGDCHSGNQSRAAGPSTRRRLAVYSMFALFACAYATLDRLPRSAASVLRGSTEFVSRTEIAETEDVVGT